MSWAVLWNYLNLLTSSDGPVIPFSFPLCSGTWSTSPPPGPLPQFHLLCFYRENNRVFSQQSEASNPGRLDGKCLGNDIPLFGIRYWQQVRTFLAQHYSSIVGLQDSGTFCWAQERFNNQFHTPKQCIKKPSGVARYEPEAADWEVRTVPLSTYLEVNKVQFLYKCTSNCQ